MKACSKAFSIACHCRIYRTNFCLSTHIILNKFLSPFNPQENLTPQKKEILNFSEQ